MIDFEEEATDNGGPTSEQLNLISRLAQQQADLEKRVQEEEERLKELKKQYNDVALNQLPEAMQEAGVLDVTTSDGTRVQVQEKMYCSVPKKRRQWVREWLEREGHEALIQYRLAASIGKGQRQAVEQAKKTLQEMGLDAQEETDFHTGQLKSLLYEYVQSGENVALEQFGAHLQRAAKISKKE